MRPYTLLLFTLLPLLGHARQYGGYDYGRDSSISYIEVFVTYRTYGLIWRVLDEPRVYVDYGQGGTSGTKPPLISADSTGHPVYFFSTLHALNWLKSQGWELLSYASHPHERYLLLTRQAQNRLMGALREEHVGED